MNPDAAVEIGAVCMACAIAHIVAEWRQWQATRWLAKLGASTSFVVLAIENGTASSVYGRLILLALIFSWLGDMLLLSLRSAFLLGGIAAFFLAHAAFAVAFGSRPHDVGPFGIALAILTIIGLGILGWLWKYLDKFYKIAVPVYLVAITVMVALAIAASFASMSPLLAIAATIFAVSDVSVARDRFVRRAIANKVWGIPLYYAAQLLLALSVP